MLLAIQSKVFYILTPLPHRANHLPKQNLERRYVIILTFQKITINIFRLVIIHHSEQYEPKITRNDRREFRKVKAVPAESVGR